MTPDPDEPREPDEIDPGIIDNDSDWRTHPLAVHVPAADEIGPTWQINVANVTEYEPADTDSDFYECGLAEPPTLEGIEVTYTSSEIDNEAQFIVNRGSSADAQLYVDLFRGLVNCGGEVFGFTDATVEITTETIELAGADDAVMTHILTQSLDDRDGDGNGEIETNLDLSYIVARYDDLLLAVGSGGFGLTDPGPQLSAEKMTALVESSAAQR